MRELITSKAIHSVTSRYIHIPSAYIPRALSLPFPPHPFAPDFVT